MISTLYSLSQPPGVYTPDSPVSSYKGNDKLFRAFARFVKNDKRRAILIAVDKEEILKNKELINQ